MKSTMYRHGRLYGHIRKALALLGCATLVSTASLQAQTYQYTYGINTTNENAPFHPIEATADGGAISVGTTQNAAGNKDIYLIKTNNLGVLQWSFSYGSSAIGSHEEGFDVLEETDYLGNTTGYVAVGRISDGNGNDVFMLKVDQNGGFLWGRRYGYRNNLDEVGHAIIKNGSTYLVTGLQRTPDIAGSADVLFLKTDLNGTTPQMTHTGVPNIDDGGYDLAISGGTAVIVGFTMYNNRTDGLVMGLDPASGGLSGLPRRYGNSGNNDTLFTIQVSGSNILTAGTIGYSSTAKDMWGLVVNSGGWGPVWGHAYSAFIASNNNRINLGADMRVIGSSYMLLGTTAYNADNGSTTYTRQIVLTRLNNGTGAPIAANAYGTSTQYGKASQAYGLRQVQAVYPLIGGQQNFYPITLPSTGLFDVYLIRPGINLASCIEQETQIINTSYTANSYVEMSSHEFQPPPVLDAGAKLSFNVNSYQLCYCPSPVCKPSFEVAPAPAGDLSLEVSGDAATGEVHVAAAGMEQGSPIDIFDVTGHQVRSFNVASGDGTGTIVWNGTDDAGNLLPSGVYFVRVQGAKSIATKPVQLVR